MSGALVCDLDGTLIESDLGLEFRRWLLDTGRFGIGRLLLAGTALPVNRLRRSFGRGSLLSAWSAGRSAADRTSLMEGFMTEVGDALSIRSEVMEVVEAHAGKRILLTGSERTLALSFLAAKGIDSFHAVIGAEQGRRGWTFTKQPYGRSKLGEVAEPIEVALGDSFADRHLLGSAARAHVVAGDRRLEREAARRGWSLFTFD